MTPERRALTAGWLGVMVAIAMLWWPMFAHGHTPERPDLNGWFSDLQSGDGKPCCSGDDATVLKDSDWESQDGHYRVFIAGRWWDVPDSAIISGPNKFGRTMAWPTYYYAYPADDRTGRTPLDHVIIRCFMPGSMI